MVTTRGRVELPRSPRRRKAFVSAHFKLIGALVVGALLAPRHGIKVATAGATLLAVMTIAGAVGGVELLQQASGWWLSLAVAGGMGALLRAVLHRHTSSPLRAGPGALSALLGAALALAVPELP
jgi:hypothetical protein